MPAKEVVVTLRLSEGNTQSQFRQIKSALIDVKSEITENNRALRENAKEQRALDKALKEGKVTAEQYAVSQRVLKEQRQELKTQSANLASAEAGLSAQYREAKNEVGGLTEANLRFRDKMAQATIEALRQQGILGQLEARTATLKAEQNALDNELKEGKITQEQYAAAMLKTSTELSRVEGSERELKQEVDRLNRELSEGKISVDQYRSSIAQLGQTNAQTGSSFKDIFGTFKEGQSTAAGLLSSYVGIGAAVYAASRAISDAINTVKEFEQGNANLASILGKSRSEIEALTQSAIELGPALGRAPEEVTKLQTELAKLGFTEPQIMAAQAAVIQLANATGEDLAKSAEVAAATLKGFDLEATETQRVVDVMAQSFNATSLDLEKFSVAMATLAPAAKAAGFDIEQTTGLIGVLADRGLDASVVGTSLRSMFIDLSKTGMTLEEALDQIQNSTNKTKTAFELFGERAAGAAVILAENRAETDRVTASLNKAGGAAQKMADEQLNTLTGATNRLSASWDALVLSLDKGDGFFSRTLKNATNQAASLLQVLSGNASTFETLQATGTLGAFDPKVVERIKAVADAQDQAAKTGANYTLRTQEGTKLVNLQTESLATLKSAIEEARIKEEAFNAQGKTTIAQEYAKERATLSRIVAAREGTAAAKAQLDAIKGVTDATGRGAAATSTDAEEIGKKTKVVKELTEEERKRLELQREMQALADQGPQVATPITPGQVVSGQTSDLPPAQEALAVGADPAEILAQSQSLNDQLLALDIEFYANKSLTFGEYITAKAELENEFFGLEAQQVKFDAELDGIVTHQEAIAILDAESKAGLIKTHEEYTARKKEIDRAYVQATVQQFSNLFGALSQLAEEGSAEAKALAIVQALINTYLGVTQALANLPPPASYVAAAVSLVSGLAAVKKIAGFETGGIVKQSDGPRVRNGKDTVMITAYPDEMVLNPKQQKRIKRIAGDDVFKRAGVPGARGRKTPAQIMRMMPQLERGIPNFAGGFAVGGLVRGTALVNAASPGVGQLQSAQFNALLAAKEFTANVAVSEINKVQNRVIVTEQMVTA